jgi:hypothetical protein
MKYSVKGKFKGAFRIILDETKNYKPTKKLECILTIDPKDIADIHFLVTVFGEDFKETLFQFYFLDDAIECYERDLVEIE